MASAGASGPLAAPSRHLSGPPRAARARDLVQSTFVAALESRDGGDVRRPRAWLGAVARRIASSWRRRDLLAADAASSNAGASRDPAPAADEVVERLELRQLVAEAGRFLLAGVAPGPLALRTHRLGARPARATVRVEPGGVHTVELAFADATLVHVRASDHEGTHLRDLVHGVTGERLSVGAIATAEPPGSVLDPHFGGNSNPYGIGALWSARRFGLEPVDGAGVYGTLAVERDAPFGVSIVVEQAPVAPRRVGAAVGGTVDEVAFTVVEAELRSQLGALSLRILDATDSDGAFRFEGLPRGRFALRAVGDDEGRVPGAARTVWTLPSVVVDARSGPPADVVLRAEAAVDVVVDLAGVPEGARLSVLDDRGRVLRRARPDWHVWALRLPRGAMELVVEGADGAVIGRQGFAVDGTPRRLSPGRR